MRSSDGAITSFDVPGAQSTAAWSINFAGTVTGYCTIAAVDYAFVRVASGAILKFDNAGIADQGTRGEAINDLGAVTGYYFSGPLNAIQAFLLTP